MGRRTYQMGEPDSYAQSYEFQVPIFVLTHTVPKPQPKQNARLRFTFVTDGVESAIAQAKKAAGEKNVTIVGGPTIARHCLSLGLIDELQLGIVPVLLGAGLRLFDQLDRQIELERVRISEEASITYLHFRVIKEEEPLLIISTPSSVDRGWPLLDRDPRTFPEKKLRWQS